MSSRRGGIEECIGGSAGARKILDLLGRLRRGEELTGAAKGARISRAELLRLLDAIEAELGKRLPRRPKTSRKRAPGTLARAVLYSDGGSRGNPGRAACAAVLCDESGEEIISRTEMLGTATNNVAEYRGVILALELARELAVPEVLVRMDSELVAKQLKGAYKVKHPALKPLHEQAKMLLSAFTRSRIEHIPRGENARADELVNTALDEGA